MTESTDWMALSQIPGVGVTSFWLLVDHFGSPAEVLRQSVQKLAAIPGINKRQLQGFAQKKEIFSSCHRQLRQLEESGARCLLFNDPLYPDSLRRISDPPPLLYLQGNGELLGHTAVAMVGSRASTSYGGRTAYTLAKKLAASGVVIISGLALGVDAQSHYGALAASGSTIAVLGSGIDVVYPRQNMELFSTIRKEGAIVSEYPPGTAPEGFRFPARNRIIAGLSSGVVVVEAAKKSGSLITAQLALDEGREVYSVPGRVDSFKSEGTHWLLQQGAKLVQSAEDILEDLSPDGMVAIREHGGEETGGEISTSLDSKALGLLDCLDAYPLAREELLQKSGLEISEFSEFLLLLELEGLIELLPGDEIRRIA